MEEPIDLKALWQTGAPKGLPEPAAIKSTMRGFQRRTVRKKWLIIGVSALLCVLLITAFAWSPSHFWTTWLGNSLTIAGCFVLGFTNWRSLARFNQLDNCSNIEFLAFIEKTRENQRYYYRRTQMIIMLLVSAGFILEMYEPASRHPLWSAMLFTGCTVYLLLIWFVVRPRMFRRNGAKLDALSVHVKRIIQQLEENE